MARIDDINVLLGLQQLILEQIRAIHGPRYSPSATFSVIISRFDNHGTTLSAIEYTAQAIVYLIPGSCAKWKLLAEGEAAVSTQQAMEMLYRRVQEEAIEVTERMGVGWTYDGVRVKEDEEG